MKTLLITLNTKYIHSSLAGWYLKAACAGDALGEVKVLEYTINDRTDYLLSRIYEEKCDVAAFSCYIWNFDEVIKIVQNLKKISPHIKIVLGGPEVSYDPYNVLNAYKSVDFIISGEGEVSFKLLLKSFLGQEDLNKIEGLSFREAGNIIENKNFLLVDNLNSISSPYTDEMLESAKGKIMYFESSRGCPFSCSYCISSTFEGVRYFSIDRVKKDLVTIMESGVALVKFVDRTFNCNKKRVKEILEFIIDNAKQTRFHFEVAADLFDQDIIEIISKAPIGLIQFEIGIQSTNTATLDAVNRKSDLEKVFFYVRRVRALNNIHIHLDIIAGLPYEDYNSFKKSFDDIYRLSPHKLQLGFLKLLKGSPIRKDYLKHGYDFREYRPYEVLSNNYMGFNEIIKLKGIEDLVERYYNSGRFEMSMKHLTGNCFDSPFVFYESFYKYYIDMGYTERSISSRELYSILYGFIENTGLKLDLKLINELLKFDFLLSDNTNNLPSGLNRDMYKCFKEDCFDFLKDEENIKLYLPEFIGLAAKKIYNKVHFERFSFDLTDEKLYHEKKDTVFLFNYEIRDEVTRHCSCSKIQEIKLGG